ncbi:MFS general substrate transporter [Auriscalpium vulgare]|uniref:MFS general substrate transporter n=1 Tax=Auriscalpium vulgare TaxID=40419 RepID=A0ACB8S971_9AGAM|nr:MFS general substrate transporter [Auriscalpium vulgare]
MTDPVPILGFTRLLTLFSSLLASIGSGTNYVVSAYAPQLGSRLHLTHTQLNLVALAGNVGVYTSGPAWGKLVDGKGPRPLLAGAFILLLSGYSGMRILYDSGLDEGENLSHLHFGLLIVCGFSTGLGGCAGMASAINSTAKSFPDRYRAVVVGIVMSGFGLSAFFFSAISHMLFPGNTSDFLLVLALGTSLPMIWGFFFLRPVALPPNEVMHTLEHGTGEHYAPLSASDPDRVLDQPSSSQIHLLLTDTESDDDNEDNTPRRPGDHLRTTLNDSVELSPSGSLEGFQQRSRSRSIGALVEADKPPIKKIVEGRGVDLHALSLLKSSDFWLVVCINILLSGTGLMYINNAGAIAQALFSKGNPAYDEVEASVWQAAQVSTVSLMNFTGRVVIGIIADIVKSRFHYPRSFCISLVASLFILSQVFLYTVDDVHNLWLASALLGLAYGSLFGLLPTICIEWFGLAHFSENWGYISLAPVIGGNLFSLAFGRNLDAHNPVDSSDVAMNIAVTPPLGSRSAHECIEGRECYIASMNLSISACILALGLAVWAGWRDWKDRQERLTRGEETHEVLWDGAGELAGAE